MLRRSDICLTIAISKEAAMPTATLTSKNQVTIPAEVRDDMKLSQGDRIQFVRESDGKYRLERAASFESLRGILKSSVSLTDEELAQAIEDARNARADEIMGRLKS
jgi:AbrB family looped-hinge helix DNA binding protein